MANQTPSPKAAELAKTLAKIATDPKHGLTLPAKIVKATKRN